MKSASSLAAIGGVGYRWLFGSGLNLGILGGGQYLMTSQTESLTFSSFRPAVMAQLGYCF